MGDDFKHDEPPAPRRMKPPLFREALRFQFGTLKRGQHFEYLPRVFTQEGVAMLSSVLRSPRASHSANDKAVVRPFPVAASRQSAANLAEGLVREDNDGGALPSRRYAEQIKEGPLHFGFRDSEFGLAQPGMSAQAFGSDWAPPEKPHREIGFHIKEASVPYRVKRK